MRNLLILVCGLSLVAVVVASSTNTPPRGVLIERKAKKVVLPDGLIVMKKGGLTAENEATLRYALTQLAIMDYQDFKKGLINYLSPASERSRETKAGILIASSCFKALCGFRDFASGIIKRVKKDTGFKYSDELWARMEKTQDELNMDVSDQRAVFEEINECITSYAGLGKHSERRTPTIQRKAQNGWMDIRKKITSQITQVDEQRF